jgi:hypothetical protein
VKYCTILYSDFDDSPELSISKESLSPFFQQFFSGILLKGKANKEEITGASNNPNK